MRLTREGAAAAAVKTRLHVPPKEAVFKHAGHKDLGACILAWLEQKYGADLAARKRDVLAQLQAARMEAVKAAGQGGKSLTTREALRSLLSWYHVLAELDLPFGLDESKGLLRVRFEYCQALATAKMTKSYTPQLERFPNVVRMVDGHALDDPIQRLG